MDIINQVEIQIQYAIIKYGNFNSTHEAYAVLKEELDEFWDIVKKNIDYKESNDDYIKMKMIEELIQIAAISIRVANELDNNKIKFI